MTSPQRGYQPHPPAYHLVTRIPETEPYVLRPNQGLIAAIWGGVFAFDVIVWSVAYLALVSGDNQFASSLLMSAIVSCLVPPFIWYTAASGGPSLAAGPYGLWVRIRQWPVKAIFLPWEAVASIQTRRNGKVLVVYPHDQRVGQGHGRFADADQWLLKLGSPDGLATPLRGDRRPEETLGALRHFAAGRSWVG